jgi:hypothetical protein
MRFQGCPPFWLEWLVKVDENLNLRPGGATRGKWRILDGKVDSGLMSDSELQRWYPPPVSTKDRIVLGLDEQVLIMY